MIRKRTLISLILTGVMILVASGWASAADSWKYYFPITVSDNSGDTRAMYPIILEVGGQHLVDTGYMTANGTDARLRTTADKNLLMSSDNIVFVVDNLPAYGQVTYNLYTGYSPEKSDYQVIVGDGGYITVADNTTIELGDNFTIVQSGWWDTDAGDDKNAVYKAGAFRVLVSDVVAENITAQVIGTKTANALDFEKANSDGVSIPDSANFTFNTAGDDDPFSVVGWLKPETVANDGILVAKWTSALDQAEWQVFIEADGELTLMLSLPDASAYLYVKSTNTFATGQWTHFAATYDGSENWTHIKLYLNSGLEITTDANVGAYTGMTGGTSPLFLGQNAAGTYYDGIQSEIKIYNVELTSGQVSDDNFGEHKATDLVAYYPLDDGAGNPQDDSGNGHHATANTADWVSTSIPDTLAVTATGVSSGEYTVTTEANGVFFGIGVDQTNSDSWAISDNLNLNVPLYHTGLSSSPFTSKDVNEYTCTVTGAVWSATDGRFFDATNDYIALGTPWAGSVANLTAYTIEGWARTSDVTHTGTIFAERSTSSTTPMILIIMAGSAADFYHRDDVSNFANLSAGVGVVANDTWFHFAAVRRAANSWELVINGISKDTDATNVGGTSVNRTAIGASWRAAVGDVWKDDIGEVRVYHRDLSLTEINYNMNATRWRYDGSASYLEYELVGTGVPDNANDLIFLQNNVMSYADNITITVGGNQALWFEPNEMITGTTLPDRATSVANDGTITWGSNDQVIIVFGSVTSYEATVSVASVNETGFVLPLVGIPDNWWGMEFDGEDLPFYPTFLDTSTQTGIPVQTLYLLMVFGVAIALATVTIVMTRSVVVGVAFYTITMSYGANAGIVAWWIIYVFLIMVIGIIFLSSRQAMGG